MGAFTVRREVFLPYLHGLAAFPGFVLYVDRDRSRLWHRYAWQAHSDNRDWWTDIVSDDNGRTWGAPLHVLPPEEQDGGQFKIGESAGFFDDTCGRLVTVSVGLFFPGDAECDPHQRHTLLVREGDPAARTWGPATVADFGFPRGLSVSFTFPLRLSSGKILFPAMTPTVDAQGRPRKHPVFDWAPAHSSLSLLAERDAAGELVWTAGEPVEWDESQTTRGFDENTVAELAGGRLAMVLRASNAGAEETIPGCKYLAFSDNEGLRWTRPEPLRYDTGEPVESSATGSCLFRDFRDGRLYWVGNVCADGERARGNFPRSPLALFDVREEPFALARASMRVIDRVAPWEPETCQMSNFRLVQDRESGELVIFLARFGEASAADWGRANYYQYRVSF